MSRLSGEPKREYKVFVPERLAERLDLLSYDIKTGRTKYGFIAGIFELGVMKLLEAEGLKQTISFAEANGMDLNEAQQSITDLRTKALAGTATREEVREALARIREGRMSVVGQKTGKTGKKKEPAKPIDLASLLS